MPHARVTDARTILFLAANPQASARLAIDEESRAIEEKLHATKHRILRIVTKWAVRPDDLQDALLREEPTIVHFSGHGTGAAGIVLHDAVDSSPKPVGGDALYHLIAMLKGKLRIVVLNACYSEVQARAIVEEIDFVIGMNGSIGDASAQRFSVAFYRGLGFGQSVQTAFQLGVNALKLEGLADEDVPLLLVGAKASSDEVLIAEPPKPLP